MYEVNNIGTRTLSSAVQQVGTYTIPLAGKYQIRMAGEKSVGAGGILIASKQFSKNVILIIKGIQGISGIDGDSGHKGGAGIGLWENGNIALVAGGGSCTWVSGSGYVGGYGYDYWASRKQHIYYYGRNWDGTTGSNKTYCSAANCNIGATGGASYLASTQYGYGGTGYCGSGYTCATTAGGNANGYSTNYSVTSYGSSGKGYVTIVYCGPNANSICPASCGNTVSCSTGTCNYHTGLCE